jgi:hypothetical protein
VDTAPPHKFPVGLRRQKNSGFMKGDKSNPIGRQRAVDFHVISVRSYRCLDAPKTKRQVDTGPLAYRAHDRGKKAFRRPCFLLQIRP